MFSIWAKQRPISSIFASDLSKFQFYIYSQSFRLDSFVCFYGEDTVYPQEFHIGCKFPCQAAAKRAFHRSRPHSDKFHHYVVHQLIVRQWACRIYYHVAEYLVADVPFICSSSLGQLSPVYIFRNIRATFPSGVKKDLRPSFGRILFLTRPKFSAI